MTNANVCLFDKNQLRVEAGRPVWHQQSGQRQLSLVDAEIDIGSVKKIFITNLKDGVQHLVTPDECEPITDEGEVWKQGLMQSFCTHSKWSTGVVIGEVLRKGRLYLLVNFKIGQEAVVKKLRLREVRFNSIIL